MKTLVIDNYDSFTFNLVHILEIVNREKPVVITNDSMNLQEIKQLNFDNVVISPGPGNPKNYRDFGVSRDVILYLDVPILGVCLGHQGIVQYLCSHKISRAPVPMHGRTCEIEHNGKGLFANIPTPFIAARYHSLIVETLDDKQFAVTARSKNDGIIMAIAHRNKPIWGVQFHPESIITEYGYRIIENFKKLSKEAISKFHFL